MEGTTAGGSNVDPGDDDDEEDFPSNFNQLVKTKCKFHDHPEPLLLLFSVEFFSS